MKYRYRLSCPDCTGIDPEGCFDGGTWTSEDEFDTPEEAADAGYEATRRTITEYEVIDEFLEIILTEVTHDTTHSH